MIHYNVWFSFKSGVPQEEGLARVRTFLSDLKRRELIRDFALLRNRVEGSRTKMPPFQAAIAFSDQDQFTRRFAEVAASGVHEGQHGAMIENVDAMVVEIFEEITDLPRASSDD